MPNHYINLDAAKFETFLQSKGCHRLVMERHGDEVVYVRAHDKAKFLFIKIFTSIKEGETTARECGGDAIRVVCIFDNGTRNFGIGKFPRVYRTGSQEKVQERTLDRMRDAYARLNEWLKESEPPPL